MVEDKDSRNISNAIDRIRLRAKEAEKRIEKREAETPRQLFLPGMDELKRAMPNHIARSSLFAPVARGRKKLHDETVLVSRGDVEITFSGKQLDESQADVWMHAMKEAMRQKLGEPVIINRAQFLRAIGRKNTGQNYKWLHQAMKDLSKGTLIIEVTRQKSKRNLSIGKTIAFHVIDSFAYNEVNGDYELRIDPRWCELYANREYALIDWNKRMQIGQGQDMAKTLQRLLATSSNPIQRYSLDWLKAKMEYSGRMRDFRETLTTACNELARLEIINAWSIEENTRGNPQLSLWK